MFGGVDMENILIMNVLKSMEDILDDVQMFHLKKSLQTVVSGYKISEKTNELLAQNTSWTHDLEDFIVYRKMQGRSKKTCKQYFNQLIKLLSYANKCVSDITDTDITNYLQEYKGFYNIGNRSLENMRLVFSSFFSWAANVGKIKSNPMLKIGKIKYDSKVKEPFSDKEREKLFLNCNTLRDMALIEFLYSTGIRVSESVALNISDVHFTDDELIVYGKGQKERKVYLNAKSSVYLQQYLELRTDSNEALFVSLRKPHNRLTIQGVEAMLKRLGKRAQVSNVHPHRFRRTSATNALNKGMDLQYVSTMLGHSNPNTTMIYCTVDQNNVKLSHKKVFN